MPQTPMTLFEAKQQAATCDEKWPDCAPHVIVQGRKAVNAYE
jgi:hypothetical protein